MCGQTQSWINTVKQTFVIAVVAVSENLQLTVPKKWWCCHGNTNVNKMVM